MHGPTTLPDLIEHIYDAGLDPALWNDVIVDINAFVGGQACGLFSKNSISKFGVTHYYCGADPAYIQLYSETHCQFDPLAILPRFGQVTSIPDLVSYDDYRRGRFYQEWLRPQGCVDAANVVLEKSQSKCPILLTVLPSKRMVDEEMRRRIGLIVPHAHRALMINKAIDVRRAEAATFAETLNGLSAGVFLLDAGGRIVHANTAGQDMLDADDVVRAIGGQFAVRDALANRTLRDMLPVDRSAADTGNTALPLIAHDGQRYVAYVMPLASMARNGAGTEFKAVTALFVRKAELDSRSCGDLVARAFGLTPAEQRVLLAIVEVGGVPEAAEALGIAETTVKTHLYRVFSKTGASRQADLVKLVAGFSNPLAG